MNVKFSNAASITTKGYLLILNKMSRGFIVKTKFFPQSLYLDTKATSRIIWYSQSSCHWKSKVIPIPIPCHRQALNHAYIMFKNIWYSHLLIQIIVRFFLGTISGKKSSNENHHQHLQWTKCKKLTLVWGWQNRSMVVLWGSVDCFSLELCSSDLSNTGSSSLKKSASHTQLILLVVKVLVKH